MHTLSKTLNDRLQQNQAFIRNDFIDDNSPLKKLLEKEVKTLPVIQSFIDLTDSLLLKKSNNLPSLEHLSLITAAFFPEHSEPQSWQQQAYSDPNQLPEECFLSKKNAPFLLGRFLTAAKTPQLQSTQRGLIGKDGWFLGKKGHLIGLFYKENLLPNTAFIRLEKDTISLQILSAENPNLEPKLKVIHQIQRLKNSSNGLFKKDSGQWDIALSRFTGPAVRELYNTEGLLTHKITGTWGNISTGRWGLTGQGVYESYNTNINDNGGHLTKRLTGTWGNISHGQWGLTGQGVKEAYNANGFLTKKITGTWGNQGNGQWGFTGRGQYEAYNTHGNLTIKNTGTYVDVNNGEFRFKPDAIESNPAPSDYSSNSHSNSKKRSAEDANLRNANNTRRR